jgi:hypothetical protein
MSSRSKRASIRDNSPLAEFKEEVEEDTAPAPQQEAPVEAKATRKPKPGYRQTTIILPNDQLKWLGEAALRSTNDNGIVTNKTTIIKALIDVARTVNLDLAGLKSEEEISRRLIEAVTERFANDRGE